MIEIGNAASVSTNRPRLPSRPNAFANAIDSTDLFGGVCGKVRQ